MSRICFSSGGIPFARGSLFHLLKNPVYLGVIVHNDKVYQGEHETVVDEDLWKRVQEGAAAQAADRPIATREGRCRTQLYGCFACHG